MPVVEARGLTKVFSSRRRTVEAVHDLSLQIEAGERLAYIGPNGAGKSTSLKMLTGILEPTAGTATVLGLVPWRQRRQLAARIGVLFGQRSQLWSELAPRQSLRLLGAIHNLSRTDTDGRVAEVAELVDAADLLDAPVRTLSLGQRMRCELAATMLHAPEVVFLDEPTIGLDLVAKQRFRELLVRLNEEDGVTILLTSHDVADIEAVAQRVVIVNSGRVVRDSDVPALRSSLLASKVVEVRFERAQPELLVAGTHAERQTETLWRLHVDTGARPIREVLDQLLQNYTVADISVSDPPLEDVIAAAFTGTPSDGGTP